MCTNISYEGVIQTTNTCVQNVKNYIIIIHSYFLLIGLINKEFDLYGCSESSENAILALNKNNHKTVCLM